MSTPDFFALLCTPSSEDCAALCSALECLRVRVLRVSQSAHACTLARQDCFVLVIVDLDCDADWRATIRDLRQSAPGAGVVVYSRLAEERMWIDALEAGAFDLICKPFVKQELRWILESAVKWRIDRPPRHPAPADLMSAVAAAGCRAA